MIKAKITNGPSQWDMIIGSLTEPSSVLRSDLREVEFAVNFNFEGRAVKDARWKLIINAIQRNDPPSGNPPYAEDWFFLGTVTHLLPSENAQVFGGYNPKIRKGWFESVNLPGEILTIPRLVMLARIAAVVKD